MEAFSVAASVFGIASIAYCLLYNGIQLLFIFIAFREVRLCLRGKAMKMKRSWIPLYRRQ